MTNTNVPNGQRQSITAVDCERDGHCLHNSTDPQALWCCKCGQYFPMTRTKFPPITIWKDYGIDITAKEKDDDRGN